MSHRPALPVATPIALTAGLLLARLLAAPPLADPLGAPSGAPLDPSLHLAAPGTYLAFAPLFTLWDGVSMLGMSRLRGFLLGVPILFVVWRVGRGVRCGTSLRRELGALALVAVLFTAFVAAGLLWHRPMLALRGAPAGDLVVDFHSHTNVSHDVRNTLMRGFDAEANRRWHRRAGFDAVFVTDHNTVKGLSQVDRAGRPWLCPGIEVSAWRAHVVLLGDSLPVDRRRYNESLAGLLALLRTSDTAYGALSLGSLPEYERSHWDRLDTLADAGLDGLEIVNASPKANDLTRARRDSVVALARRRGLFVAGVSDSHGWGATSMVWNLVPVGSARPSGADPCPAILRRLRQGGIGAARIVERHRLRAEAGWPGWLTPVGVVWETWRGMGWLLTGSWLVWIWAIGGAAYRRQARIAPGRGSRSGGAKTAK